MVARITRSKLEPLWPVLVLEERAWRAVLDGRGRHCSAAKHAERIRGEETFSVIHGALVGLLRGQSSHGQ